MDTIVSYCPFCNSSYYPDQASVVGEGSGSWLLHTNCLSCHSSIVLLLLVGEIGISSFGLITDLTDTEVVKFQKGSAVDIDDLIELYTILSKSRKDFLSYL